MTPLLPMYTLGHDFIPASIHAGGLRYHGAAPLVSQLYKDGIIEAQAYKQIEIFEAAIAFSQAEGIIPAPEAAHAIKSVFYEVKNVNWKENQKQFCLILAEMDFSIWVLMRNIFPVTSKIMNIRQKTSSNL